MSRSKASSKRSLHPSSGPKTIEVDHDWLLEHGPTSGPGHEADPDAAPDTIDVKSEWLDAQALRELRRGRKVPPPLPPPPEVLARGKGKGPPPLPREEPARPSRAPSARHSKHPKKK